MGKLAILGTMAFFAKLLCTFGLQTSRVLETPAGAQGLSQFMLWRRSLGLWLDELRQSG